MEEIIIIFTHSKFLKMSKLRKRFNREEKLEIVNMSLDEAYTVEEIAARFGVHANSIYKWRNQFIKHQEIAFPGSGNKAQTEEQREIESLKKQLRTKEIEVEILKKAVGIFSSPDRKNLLS